LTGVGEKLGGQDGPLCHPLGVDGVQRVAGEHGVVLLVVRCAGGHIAHQQVHLELAKNVDVGGGHVGHRRAIAQ